MAIWLKSLSLLSLCHLILICVFSSHKLTFPTSQQLCFRLTHNLFLESGVLFSHPLFWISFLLLEILQSPSPALSPLTLWLPPFFFFYIPHILSAVKSFLLYIPKMPLHNSIHNYSISHCVKIIWFLKCKIIFKGGLCFSLWIYTMSYMLYVLNKGWINKWVNEWLWQRRNGNRSVPIKGQIRGIVVVFSRIKDDRSKRFRNLDGYPSYPIFDVQELPYLI